MELRETGLDGWLAPDRWEDRIAVHRRWVDPAEAAELAARLRPFARWTLLDGPLPARSAGLLLGPSAAFPRGPPLELYRQSHAELPLDGWAARIAALLARLTGRPAAPIPGYGIATMRIMPEGVAVPAHRDRYQAGSWDARDAHFLGPARMSWYLQLVSPPAGGLLHVGTTPVPLGAGDLVSFCASTWEHHVSAPIGGERLSFGGFYGLTRDGVGWSG